MNVAGQWKQEKKTEIERAARKAAKAAPGPATGSGTFFCPKCGYHEPRNREASKAAITCPRCGHDMSRGLAVL